ncbi:MAG: glycoside hydrolase family 78 protein [Prevotellaceae bacterium]|jgi:alpha-L-rhamnosidase|nr:glycoside hydrolase family 78 protein [Prevotellaceae bacterium]
MKSLSVSFILMFFVAGISAQISLVNPRTDYKINPIGIDNPQPRLSWESTSPQRNTMQAAYRIRAAHSEKDLTSGKNLVWDSERISSDRSNQIPYLGTSLRSGERVYWQVKIEDNRGKSSAWSVPAFFEMGLLELSDRKAAFISADIPDDTKKSSPAPMLRKEFILKGKVKSARIYATAHGLYILRLNGAKVGDQLFAPGWTSYKKRLQYQVYDVSAQLQQGKNALGIILGDGWYRGHLTWDRRRNTYGDRLAAMIQLEVLYTDGSRETILSDDSWKSSTGPILASDIYNGELYDARLKIKGWDKAGFDDSNWKETQVKHVDMSVLTASEGVPVRAVQKLKPIKEITSPKGERIFDMGQNMVGWIRFKLKGNKGDKIKFNFAETLDKDGNFYTENLRSAACEDTYIFSGEEIEEYEPHFTFHGFRYVKISEYQDEVKLDDLTGVVIHSDMPVTGNFTCSDSLVNQLQHNILWGLWGNFLDVPTDCPQRDERLGWTGDAQAFAPTACFNVDATAFFTKWLKDLAADQHENGSVPHVVPDMLREYGATGWADAAIIVPWSVYKAYGNVRILEEQYNSMKAWVEYMRKGAGDKYIFNFGHHFGDWLAFASTRSDYPGATTDKDLIATMFFANSTKILEKTAIILGKTQDADDYAKLFVNIRKAFQNEFMTGTGRLSSNTQTAYVLALAFDLVPNDLKENLAQRLANDLHSFGHITTGFLGTPMICKVLTDCGHVDLAYMLLMRKHYPSWLYPITRGATTIWERWDGIKPDGSFQDAGMNSFNHYAYGAVGNWLYTSVAGIQNAPESAGYKKIVIAPHPHKELSQAQASLKSVYGEIVSAWQIKDGLMNLKVKIPTNTQAEIHLPIKTVESITESGKAVNQSKEIQIIGADKGRTLLSVGSGEYDFYIKME